MRKFVAGVIVGVVLASVSVGWASNAVRLVVNGREVISDVPAQIIDGRTLVPARGLAEALGAKVEWDGGTRTVVVTSNTAATTGEWENLQVLARGNKWTVGQEEGAVSARIEANSRHLTIPLQDGPDVLGTSDNGLTVRTRIVAGRILLNVPDLIQAGFLPTP